MLDKVLIDPLGRTLVLRERTWDAHILKGHSEVTGCQALAQNAVTAPVEIRYSRSDPDCRIYYGTGPREKLMIAVVADVKAGVVKTAYLTKRPSAGGVEWSSPTL